MIRDIKINILEYLLDDNWDVYLNFDNIKSDVEYLMRKKFDLIDNIKTYFNYDNIKNINEEQLYKMCINAKNKRLQDKKLLKNFLLEYDGNLNHLKIPISHLFKTVIYNQEDIKLLKNIQQYINFKEPIYKNVYSFYYENDINKISKKINLEVLDKLLYNYKDDKLKLNTYLLYKNIPYFTNDQINFLKSFKIKNDPFIWLSLLKIFIGENYIFIYTKNINNLKLLELFYILYFYPQYIDKPTKYINDNTNIFINFLL
jgi:hypothetical protein